MGGDVSHISCFILGCLWTSDHKLFLLSLFPLKIKIKTLVKHAAIFRLKPCGRPKVHVVCPTRNHNYQAGSHLRDFNLHNLHLFFSFNTPYAVTQKTPPSSYSTIMVRSLEPSNPSQMPPFTPFPILLLVSQMPNDLGSFFLKPNKQHRKACLKDISIKN